MDRPVQANEGRIASQGLARNLLIYPRAALNIVAATEGAEMKRTTALILIATMSLSGVMAQGTAAASTSLPVSSPAPQFALSILTDYFEDEARSGRTGGIVLTSVGSAVFAAGVAGFVYSLQEPPTALYGDNNGWMLVRGLSIGLGVTGGVVGGLGIFQLSKPLDGYKGEYAWLYAEKDPVVQEAIAYGIMKDLADEARRSRITGSIVNISIPVATAASWAIIAASTNTWEDFGGNVLGSASWAIPSLIGGIVTLVSGKSVEERMLESYRTMSGSITYSN
jgi:hypothetical protein